MISFPESWDSQPGHPARENKLNLALTESISIGFGMNESALS